jgi:hypothetical protein
MKPQFDIRSNSCFSVAVGKNFSAAFELLLWRNQALHDISIELLNAWSRRYIGPSGLRQDDFFAHVE